MKSQIQSSIAASTQINTAEITLHRALPNRDTRSVGPFVFFDHFTSSSNKGIGDKPHPHAGIELITYLFEGEVLHNDSLGNQDLLKAGDAQWFSAGSGALHSEKPQCDFRHGIQVWLDLPLALKDSAPQYAYHDRDSYPTIQQDGATIKLLAGELAGEKGPINSHSKSLFAHIALAPGASIELDTNDQDEFGLYSVDGTLTGPQGETLKPIAIHRLTAGNGLTVSNNADKTINFVIFGGQKITHPVLYSGPFVMDTEQKLELAYQRYHAGEMGRLQGVPF